MVPIKRHETEVSVQLGAIDQNNLTVKERLEKRFSK
jgi:hypothetical protein